MGKLELNKKRKSALYNTAFELFTTKGLPRQPFPILWKMVGVAKNFTSI